MSRPYRSRLVTPLVLLPIFVACTNHDVASPPPAAEDVAGTYVGIYDTEYDDTARFGDGGWGGRVGFVATVVLNIERSAGDLSGTWALDGMEEWGGSRRTRVFGWDHGRAPPLRRVHRSHPGNVWQAGAVQRRGVERRGNHQTLGGFPLADSNCDVPFTTPTTMLALKPQD